MNLHRTYLLCLAALVTVIFVVKSYPHIDLSFLDAGNTPAPVQAATDDSKMEVAGTVTQPLPLYEGKYVVVHLGSMQIDLRSGTTTLSTMPILTIGKPGSYYETIGGAYGNDYKIRNHFSSIGHVYMPWSVHVFGNFFVHGIPYYENGKKVSGEYSGGCIRLSDADAEKLYEFVERGTPIVVTENDERDFAPLATSTLNLSSMDMTRLMAATVSLEVLTQDDSIYDPTTKTYTTRRKLLPRLITGQDDSVIGVYASARGNETFLMYMNLKAQALGLTNTHFSEVDAPALTSSEDLARFQDYVQNYKTYLLTLGSPTPQPVASQ